ncbi:hypothetical protein B0H11DRAFT_60584 [Mycena galericulata]|nr:hypothetical protein B0H11DRAFT_60584 [Mycena galericulata]
MDFDDAAPRSPSRQQLAQCRRSPISHFYHLDGVNLRHTYQHATRKFCDITDQLQSTIMSNLANSASDLAPAPEIPTLPLSLGGQYSQSSQERGKWALVLFHSGLQACALRFIVARALRLCLRLIADRALRFVFACPLLPRTRKHMRCPRGPSRWGVPAVETILASPLSLQARVSTEDPGARRVRALSPAGQREDCRGQLVHGHRW